MRFLEKVIFWVRYRFYRYTALSKKQIFISAIDLMQPQNGVVNATQLLVVSRMLDIELVREGKNSYWDSRINEKENGRTQELVESNTRHHRRLIDSIDKYGWDYNISDIRANINPFFAYNGTHRLAYSLLKNPYQVVPVSFDYDGWSWSNKSGVEQMREFGLTNSEIEVLLQKYYKLIGEHSYDWLFILTVDEYNVSKERIEQKIKSIGKINNVDRFRLSKLEIPNWFSEMDRRFFKNIHTDFVVIRISTPNNNIIFDKKDFRSSLIENIMRDCKIYNYTYTPTITKSIEMDLWLKENSTKL